MSEIRPIPSAPGYGVTRDGRVFRTGKPRAGYPSPYQLKPHPGLRGYLTVGLSRVTTPIHMLVAEVYVPNPENKPEVAHNDGNKHNNHVSNLRWATRKENNDDRFGHGTVLRGTAIKSSKLTPNQVRSVKRKLASGRMLQREIAAQYGVSRRAIGKIHTGDTWRHVG